MQKCTECNKDGLVPTKSIQEHYDEKTKKIVTTSASGLILCSSCFGSKTIYDDETDLILIKTHKINKDADCNKCQQQSYDNGCHLFETKSQCREWIKENI